MVRSREWILQSTFCFFIRKTFIRKWASKIPKTLRKRPEKASNAELQFLKRPIFPRALYKLQNLVNAEMDTHK